MQILHIFEFCSASWLGQIQKCAESASVKCDAIKNKPFSAGQGRLNRVIQLISIRPKSNGFSTGNHNQDQVSVSVEEKCVAFDKSEIRDKKGAKKYCKG